ncbi:MAG TPA: hypothetical protein VKO18_07905 [Terriglobia bacterium]|nr:hypothetical protein [Terriglobia bacterium]
MSFREIADPNEKGSAPAMSGQCSAGARAHPPPGRRRYEKACFPANFLGTTLHSIRNAKGFPKPLVRI